ncbi:hypothetical protein G7K_6122-t1 [Saitoella complicata NRRL Y-17804]|uniref:Cullin family profile domain-containing protein n=2 Tax=Saitoella complicata (strain BCRC 22490 / CBS 7301 / JCM 7358 / NBRC 10748 / NRRL Y-17804) TaxID=698492 RepID=A0A0E9NQB3_SAICN|nr:hypothetical protein G7K_6122-t1 [Saitoella complicata NRRL Y-17804]
MPRTPSTVSNRTRPKDTSTPGPSSQDPAALNKRRHSQTILPDLFRNSPSPTKRLQKQNSTDEPRITASTMLNNFPTKGTPLPTNSTSPSSKFPARLRAANGSRPAATGVRKLQIKNLRTTSDSAAKQTEYYAATLDKLRTALDCVANETKIGDSLEELYRGCENLVRGGKAKEVHDVLRNGLEVFAKQVQEQVGSRVAGAGGGSEAVVTAIEQSWSRWCERLGMIRQIFFYLDRTYILQTQGLLSIWDTGLDLFKKRIADHEALRADMMNGVFSLFERERNGEAVNMTLLLSIIRMLTALNLYSAVFHEAFILHSRTYYMAEAQRKLGEITVPQYIRHVAERLHAESDRCVRYGLERRTRRRIITEAMEKVMIDDNADEIVDSLEDMVNDNDVPGLKLLYDLFFRIDQVSMIRAAWVDYIRKHGLTLVQNPARDAEMVGALLTFKAKLNEIVKTSFNDNTLLSQGLREAFENFINKRPNKPAEMIAKHVDALLRSGNRAMSENDLESEMEKALLLFRFISGKDVFEAFYKKDLAKRLLLNKSASADAERSMLTKLKTECGPAFTQKLEGMFKDIDVSKDFILSYKETKHVQDKSSSAELYVNVLSQAFWPTYPDVNVILPEHMAKDLEAFKLFYLSKQTGRKLHWRHALGHCELTAGFPKGRKQLSVSLFQAVVMLLFNDVEDGQSLSFKEIKTATNLDDKELQRTLQSLACGKHRVLTKEPKGRDVNETDTFSVNLGFNDKLIRIKINQIQLKETQEENKATHAGVAQDRVFQIDAAIIRIMKARKKISHRDLTGALYETLKFPIQPADLKKRIESLIERDYMERAEDDSNTYQYVA